LLWEWLEPADAAADYRIVRVAVSPSARWIAVGSESGWIGIIDQTKPESPQRFRGGKGSLRDLGFSKDEQWLVVTNKTRAKHPVQVLGSLEPMAPGEDVGEPVAEILGKFGEHTSNVVAAPDGTAVFGNSVGSIEVHAVPSGATLRRFTFR
jgi:hypothetical protein